VKNGGSPRCARRCLLARWGKRRIICSRGEIPASGDARSEFSLICSIHMLPCFVFHCTRRRYHDVSDYFN
jgi:hypothetical protein